MSTIPSLSWICMLSFPIAKLLINSRLVFTSANIDGIHDLLSSGPYLINFKPLLWDINLELVSPRGLLSWLVDYIMLNRRYLIFGCWPSGLSNDQCQDIYSYNWICVIPWVPFSSLLEFLSFFNRFHYWLLLRWHFHVLFTFSAGERCTWWCVHSKSCLRWLAEIIFLIFVGVGWWWML